ncbi:MAG: dockerin type I repeat-containing protein, partial [Ruminococcus sp.]|nr:dockerin type I repeat-containing protein [Ruminococcus sp.]
SPFFIITCFIFFTTVILDGNEIFTWGWFGYDFKNDEDLVAFKNYLTDNNIEYEESSFVNGGANIRLVGYKHYECFQISKKIKEDTGLIQMLIIPEDLVMINATDVVNELPEVTLAGDANEDGEVNISDAVLIMQSIANPEEFELTWQGMANADIYGDGDGVTLMDAFTIQEMSLNKGNV